MKHVALGKRKCVPNIELTTLLLLLLQHCSHAHLAKEKIECKNKSGLLENNSMVFSSVRTLVDGVELSKHRFWCK